MTREEAIKHGKEQLEIFGGTHREFIEMSIKALEQEPTTKNDLAVDCISRADVLKLMQDNWHTHNGDWAMQESMDDIRALPSVIPQEPKTGHWVHGEYCSECGWNIPAYIIARKWQKYMDTTYCPNCGAKMVEPQESEDKE